MIFWPRFKRPAGWPLPAPPDPARGRYGPRSSGSPRPAGRAGNVPPDRGRPASGSSDEARALIGEAAFLEHPPRGRIDDPRGSGDLAAFSIGEERIDERPRRLGGIALPPGRGAEPDSRDAACPSSGLGPMPTTPMRLLGLPFGVMASCRPCPSALDLRAMNTNRSASCGSVRVRNSCRHLGDRFLTGETHDGLYVRKTGPAQPEAARFQTENIVTGEVGKHGLAPIRLGSFWAPK